MSKNLTIDRWRAAGLCAGCGGTPVTGKTYCQDCVEKARFRSKKHKANNPERVKEKWQRYFEKNHDRIKAQKREAYSQNKEKASRINKVYRDRLRSMVIEHYGGWVCWCCHFDGRRLQSMVSIDHLLDNGASHRRELGGSNSSTAVYRDIIKKGFPPEYQVLCMNCNFSKGTNGGVCEHITAGMHLA